MCEPQRLLGALGSWPGKDLGTSGFRNPCLRKKAIQTKKAGEAHFPRKLRRFTFIYNELGGKNQVIFGTPSQQDPETRIRWPHARGRGRGCACVRRGSPSHFLSFFNGLLSSWPPPAREAIRLNRSFLTHDLEAVTGPGEHGIPFPSVGAVPDQGTTPGAPARSVPWALAKDISRIGALRRGCGWGNDARRRALSILNGEAL